MQAYPRRIVAVAKMPDNCQVDPIRGQKTQRDSFGKSLLPVWLFLCASAAAAWIVWLWPISKQIYLHITLAVWRVNIPLSNIKLLIGNALPGLLALAWTSAQGKQELHDLVSSLLAWKTKPRWYLLSIVLPSGVFLVSMCAVLIFFSERPIRPPGLVLFNSLGSLPFGPLWEEIAWRAFALRKLQGHYSRLLSALIIGVYWAVWHIPLWLLTLNYLTFTLLLVICINLVAWSVIFAFLYDRSGQSLPVTILLHATYLTVQNHVAAMVLHGTIYIIPVAAALSVCTAVVFAKRLSVVGEDRH